MKLPQGTKPTTVKEKASIKHESFSLTSSRSNAEPSQAAKEQMPWKRASSHVGPPNYLPRLYSSFSKYLQLSEEMEENFSEPGVRILVHTPSNPQKKWIISDFPAAASKPPQLPGFLGWSCRKDFQPSLTALQFCPVYSPESFNCFLIMQTCRGLLR